MIVATMLHLTVIGGLIAAAAWLVERACMQLDIARRWTWLAAMLAMCAVPLLPAPLLAALHVPLVMIHDGVPTIDDARVMNAPGSGANVTPSHAVASGALLIAAGLGAVRLARLRRSWTLWRREAFSVPTSWHRRMWGRRRSASRTHR